jgi:hypothetical protein
MGAAFKLDFTYRYSHPSEFTTQGLRLATFGGTSAEATEHPFFFDGQMRQPHVVANMLLSLAKVVSTRFWMPLNPALLDPVATSSEEMLRFEGFSSCCGVYARADVDASTFDADIVGRGTTNVDFNSAMRGALSRIRPSDSVRLAVGSDAIQLTSGDQAVVEKKVKLPIRWIKGFTERICQGCSSDSPFLPPKLCVLCAVCPGAAARSKHHGSPHSVGDCGSPSGKPKTPFASRARTGFAFSNRCCCTPRK